MKLLDLIKIIILLVIVASCGNEKNGNIYDYKNNYDQDSYEVKDKNEFKNIIKKSYLTGGAPTGLGLLFIKKTDSNLKTKISSCTWFLIDTNVAMTNSHCIPQYLKDNQGEDCSNYLGGVIKTKTGSSHFYCKEILQYSVMQKNNFNRSDYALIKIDQKVLKSDVFNISRAGFESGKETHAHLIDTIYSDNSFHGHYRKSTCISYKKSIIGSFFNKSSTIIPLLNKDNYRPKCRVISGNSGSPITSLESQNLAIGIVYASSLAGHKQDYKEIKRLKKKLKNSKVKDFALATNLSCLDLIGFNQTRESDCDAKNLTNQETKSKQYLTSAEKALAILNLEVKKLEKTLSPMIIFQKITNKNKTIAYLPLCIKPLPLWTENELKDIERKGVYLFTRRSTYTTIAPIIKTSIKSEIDQYGLLSFKISAKRIREQELYIDHLENINDLYQDVGMVLTTDPEEKRSDEESPLKLRLCLEQDYFTTKTD